MGSLLSTCKKVLRPLYIFHLISACGLGRVEFHNGTLPEASAPPSASSSVATVNSAPNTPQSITCASPIELTPNNNCSLTAAATPDADGHSVTYVIDATSTCSNTTITNATTGAASYTAPA